MSNNVEVTKGTITNEELSAYAYFKMKQYDNDTTIALANCVADLFNLLEDFNNNIDPISDQAYARAITSCYTILKLSCDDFNTIITCNHIKIRISINVIDDIKCYIKGAICSILDVLRCKTSTLDELPNILLTALIDYGYNGFNPDEKCLLVNAVRISMKADGFVYDPEPEKVKIKYIITHFKLTPWIILNNALLSIRYPDTIFTDVRSIKDKDQFYSEECILSYADISELEDKLISLHTAKDMGYNIDEIFTMIHIVREELEDVKSFVFIIIVNGVKRRILNEIGEPRK